jgi:L-threonylcarbamoyladenylate synthase
LEFEKDIVNCFEALKNGGLILYPTDTIWGIGCDATNENAVQKIYVLKKRPDEKSMIVLVTDEKELLRYIAQPDPGVFNYLKETEKPTTVIYQGARGLAGNLINKDGSIAIRICKDPFCKHLIKLFQKPIVSTSANISGALSPKNFSEISEEIRTNVDYIVQYRQHDKTGAEPSTLIKWEKGKAIILRP